MRVSRLFFVFRIFYLLREPTFQMLGLIANDLEVNSYLSRTP